MNRRILLLIVPVSSIGFLLLLCGLIFPAAVGAQEPWSFAAISDIHSEFRTFQNVLHEIKAPGVPREVPGGSSDFVLILGDFSPVSINYEIFKKTFPKGRPVFLPVRGNHETSRDLLFIERVIFPDVESSMGQVTRFGKPGLSYYVDWKNTRLILLDQYADFKKSQPDGRAIQWLDQAIESAHDADHVFLGFHEPYLFWDTEEGPFRTVLLKHRPRIRTLLFGHTHMYFRAQFPIITEGIQAISVGNAGRNTHSDNRQTIVNVSIDGPHAWVRTVQTPADRAEFRLSDHFRLTGP